MVAGESRPARDTVTGFATDEKPKDVLAELKKIKTLNWQARHQLIVNDLPPDSLCRIPLLL